MNGLALCRAIRAEPTYRSIPIVLMTAASMQVSRADCDYAALVRKPFEVEALLTIIEQVLNERADQ
jgi:CheY-like chemotaxis protein